MNGEQFLNVLSDSKAIENISLNDLEVLMLKYPFSKNIHALYLKKKNLLGLTQKNKADEKLMIQHNHPILLNQIISNQMAHPDHQSINELYNTILSDIEEEKTNSNLSVIQTKSISPVNKIHKVITDKEDIVEKSVDISIEKHERKQELKQQVELKNKQFQQDEDFTESIVEEPSKDSNSDIKYIEVPKLSSIKHKKKPSKTKQKSKDIKSKALKKKKAQKAISKAKNKKPKEKTKVKPVSEDKDMTYFDWLDNLKTTSEIVNKKQKKQTKKKKSAKKKAKAVKKKEKLQSKIDKSLVRNRSIYTETLAILMEKQGHKKEAINIYKQLMLNNPEKNDYFAGRIQKLI